MLSVKGALTYLESVILTGFKDVFVEVAAHSMLYRSTFVTSGRPSEINLPDGTKAIGPTAA